MLHIRWPGPEVQRKKYLYGHYSFWENCPAQLEAYFFSISKSLIKQFRGRIGRLYQVLIRNDREGGTLLILTDKHLSLNHELLVYFRIKVSTWVKQNSTTLTTVELSRGTILKHGIETSWSVIAYSSICFVTTMTITTIWKQFRKKNT